MPFVKSKATLDDWKHNLDILVSGLKGPFEGNFNAVERSFMFCHDALTLRE